MRFLKLFKGIRKGYFVMLGSGRTTYHFVYIDDVVDAWVLAYRDKAAYGKTYNLSSGIKTTVEELIGLLKIQPRRKLWKKQQNIAAWYYQPVFTTAIR